MKSDIFHAYMALLRQTRPAVGVSHDPDCMDQEEGPVCMLQTQVPAIVKAVHNQMKEKSIKTRQDCFTLLKELVIVLPGALTNHIPALIPGIQYSLGLVPILFEAILYSTISTYLHQPLTDTNNFCSENLSGSLYCKGGVWCLWWKTICCIDWSLRVCQNRFSDLVMSDLFVIHVKRSTHLNSYVSHQMLTAMLCKQVWSSRGMF